VYEVELVQHIFGNGGSVVGVSILILRVGEARCAVATCCASRLNKGYKHLSQELFFKEQFE
jgi:hypothetical protein